MLISEMIAELERAKASGGDVEVYLTTYDDCGESTVVIDAVDCDIHTDHINLNIY